MPLLRQLLIATALAIAATPTPSATLQDASLGRALQGVWCNSDDEGKTCYGYDEYLDGTSIACGLLPENGMAYTSTMSYKIEGSRICAVVTASSSPLIAPGFSFCDEILEIDERVMRSRMFSFETPESRFRVPRSHMTCPISDKSPAKP